MIAVGRWPRCPLKGGLGFQDPVWHAPAAYVASFSSSSLLCSRIWDKFDALDVCGASQLQETLDVQLNPKLRPPDRLAKGIGVWRQKGLSRLVDEAVKVRLQAEHLDRTDINVWASTSFQNGKATTGNDRHDDRQ